MLKHAWCVAALVALWCVADIMAQAHFTLTTWCYDAESNNVMSCDLRMRNATSGELITTNVTSSTSGFVASLDATTTTTLYFEAVADGYYGRNLTWTWSDNTAVANQYIHLTKHLLRNEFRAILFFDAGNFYGSNRKLMPLIEPKTPDSSTWGVATVVGGDRLGDCNAADAFKPLCTSPDTDVTRLIRLETTSDPSSVAPSMAMRMLNLAEGAYTFKAVIPPLGTTWADKGIRVELFSGGGLQWGAPDSVNTVGLLATFDPAGAKNNYYKYWSAFAITVDGTGNATLASKDEFVVSPASTASAPWTVTLAVVVTALTTLLSASAVSL